MSTTTGETINDDGTVSRIVMLRLPPHVWEALDLASHESKRSIVALSGSVLSTWAEAYVATWRERWQGIRSR